MFCVSCSFTFIFSQSSSSMKWRVTLTVKLIILVTLWTVSSWYGTDCCCVALMSSDVGWHILRTSWDQCRSMLQYNFTSTETRRLVRTATSTFTQLLNYVYGTDGWQAVKYPVWTNQSRNAGWVQLCCLKRGCRILNMNSVQRADLCFYVRGSRFTNISSLLLLLLSGM